jgi:hypothetical protein
MALPAALVPTMATEAPPPAAAGLAWFARAGPGGPGQGALVVGYLLGGYAVIMALAQVRLTLAYSRLSFTPLLTGFISWIAARTGAAGGPRPLSPAS